MDKIKAYTDLIEIASKQVANMLGQGLQDPSKVEFNIETLLVDDDDCIHVVLSNHKHARAIGARVEVIKELKNLRNI